METTPATDAPARHLVILGASARGLAESASRAGWTVHAADLFCDLDLLLATRTAVRVGGDHPGGYPRGLAIAALRFPASAPWCYTGAIENHPDLIDAVAAARPLAGNPAALVRRIRDPALIAATVVEAGLAYPDTHRLAEGLPTDGTYLVKPLASAGGRGIRAWTSAAAASWSACRGAVDHPGHIWQRFVAGTPMSASYVMSNGAARLVGLTRQLVGEDWCHATRFAWCGGVTSDRAELSESFERLGVALAAAFRPVGAIGVDAVVDESGHVSVLEVNPRPTASMELFERSTGISVAAAHLAACGHATGWRAAHEPAPRETGSHWAKAVVFTGRDVRVNERLLDSLRQLAMPWTRVDGGWAALADIPAADQVLSAGSPICTLFASGRRPEDALARLRSRVAAADRLLRPATASAN